MQHGHCLHLCRTSSSQAPTSIATVITVHGADTSCNNSPVSTKGMPRSILGLPNTPTGIDILLLLFCSICLLFISMNETAIVDINKNSNNQMAFLQIEGERRVLAANRSNRTLATCAIRPSGIFGEGDATFFPTLVAKARQGKLKYYIGNGRNLVEFTYVGNVAQAHIEVTGCACLVRSGLHDEAHFTGYGTVLQHRERPDASLSVDEHTPMSVQHEGWALHVCTAPALFWQRMLQQAHAACGVSNVFERLAQY